MTLRTLLTFALLTYVCPPAFLCSQVDFQRDVLPILQEHCIDCHGAQSQESALRLDSMVGALRGGDSGEAVIVPGSSTRSHLIERVTTSSKQLRMPPDDAPALSAAQVEVLSRWIDVDADWQLARQELAARKHEHWSFQPIVRPQLPNVGEQHPIDAFIVAKLQQEGLALSPRARPDQLLRRLMLVMHGLPPTPDQLDRFLSDQRADAWVKWTDEVLDSPRYGERWAMHWLDLIRFGETNGFETNRERPYAYRFRDWVIAALNDDKPYDRFVKEQLAGDALGEPLGTGFLVAGPNDIVKGQDKLLGLMQRQDELSDIVNTAGTAFLGLTTGCARCHNHKFDPISQVDFYALQAVFSGVEHADRELPLSGRASGASDEDHGRARRLPWDSWQIWRASVVFANRSTHARTPNALHRSWLVTYDLSIDKSSGGEPCLDEVQLFSGEENVALASKGATATSSGDFVHPLHKLEHLNDGLFGNAHSWIASTTESAWIKIELTVPALVDRVLWGRDREGQFADRVAVQYRIELSTDGLEWNTVASSQDRMPIDGDFAKLDSSAISAEHRPRAQELLGQLSQLETARNQLRANNKAYTGKFVTAQPIHRLFRGDPTAPREAVAPGAITALSHQVPIALAADAPEQTRRLALAEWIASPNNPLTARVIVNRVWQFHFGTGLVDTPSDFGANGTLPSHPELLDWLASELMDHNWSLKHLHRTILASKTWQQSSLPNEAALARDAQSRWLWRFPPRRLEAEPIRDSVLAVTGNLDLRAGGPGFSAFEVELENVRHYFPKKEYGPADWRRMIYMTKVRQEKDSTFGVFDCPDASQVAPKRSRSTTPLQALNLLNGRFVNQQAELLAERLSKEQQATSDQIELAYRLCFSRAAAPDETAAAIEFIQQNGLVQFCRAMLNANEMVFIP